MLNTNAIPLEEDASGDLSASSNEALTLTSTVSRGNYHQCGSARRVKVYELKGETWFDRGTGYCAASMMRRRRSPSRGAAGRGKCQFLEGIDVPAEADVDEERANTGCRLRRSSCVKGTAAALPFRGGGQRESRIRGHPTRQQGCQGGGLQRQQDTLVVWTEPTGVDMALSFQEAEGCNEVWEFLTEVQKHFMGLAEEALTDSPPTTPNPHSPTGVLGMSASGSSLEPLFNIMGEYKGLQNPASPTWTRSTPCSKTPLRVGP